MCATVLGFSTVAGAQAQVQVVPTITTLAGNGTAGYSGDGGAPTSAELNSPFGVAVDKSGNVYIADLNNHCIREIVAATGMIQTIAGNGTPGFSGDGQAAAGAQLNFPYGVAVDGAGNVYIADTYNHRVREIVAATGNIQTIAGNGTNGYNGDGIAPTGAELNYPYGVAVDNAGNIYIADTDNHRVREIVAATGNIATVAGNGTNGYNGDNIAATAAELSFPEGVTVDSAGNVYIADTHNQRAREVAVATGMIATVAGTGTAGFNNDGIAATSAELNLPTGVAVDGIGNIYIADSVNQRIREIVAATGKIQTFAGNGTHGNSGNGGAATGAELNVPSGVTVDSAGNLYVGDASNQTIREASYFTTFPATVLGGYSAIQNVNIELISAQTISNIAAAASLGAAQEYLLGGVTGCTMDGVTLNPAGTDCTVPILFAPTWPGVHGVPLIVSAGTGTYTTALVGTGVGPLAALMPGIIGTIAGNGTFGFSGDGSAATGAELSYPEGMTLDSAGNVYIADYSNNRIREIFAATGKINTIAGDGTYGYNGDGVTATNTSLNSAEGVAVDGAGNVYIADTYNQRIREVVAATGDIETIAGNGNLGFSGDGTAATSAELNQPGGVAVDSAGNIYIADTGNQRIREVVAATGKIETIAGNGTSGYGGDGGAAVTAELNNPCCLAVDSGGNVYIADTNNQRIREVLAATGQIETIAGNGKSGFSGDGGAATSGELNSPHGVAVDAAGNVYFADSGNSRIREVIASTGTIETVAGNGALGYSGDGGAATGAELKFPYGVGLDSAGNLYLADTLNSVIRSIQIVSSTLSFATTPAGQTSPDSPQTMTLENMGNALLNITSVSYADDFPESSGVATDCTGTTNLASGSTCTLSIDFSPQIANMTAFSTPLNEFISFTSNDLNGTDVLQAVIVSGSGTLSAATLTAPTPNTVLAGPVVTFSWPSTAGANGYALSLGTSVGSNNLYSSGLLSNTSATAFSLPTNAETVYARLYTFVGSGSEYNDYVFTAANQASLTSPAPGSVLTGPSVTFNWSGSPEATTYSFRLGTTLGANNLYGSGSTSATSATVTGLPTNGETIYARLYTNYISGGTYIDYVFTASTQAALISPSPSSVLTGPTVTFNWSTAHGATSYNFRLGTTFGGADLYGSGIITATSVTVSNLPTNGHTLYLQLCTHYGSILSCVNNTFTAASQAALTSPVPGSLLTGPVITFSWSAGAGNTGYSFRLGTTQGGNNIYGSGSITTTSVAVSSLPTNGVKIYARLYTSFGSNAVYSDYVFTAATQGLLTSPSPGSVVTGPKVTFSWSPGAGNTGYSFRLGTTQGGNNIYGSGAITATTVTVSSFPTNYQTVYARLYTNFGSSSVYADYAYTAALPAALTSPAPGSTLPASKATFTWSASNGSTSYSFRLGTTVGGNDLYGSGAVTATSATVSNLPTNGKTIYGRLYTNFGSLGVYSDYVFTASSH